MMLMGDEVRRTQHGNNNAYCQDNEISWFDWTLLDPPGSPPLREDAGRTAPHARKELGLEGVSLNELLQQAEIHVARRPVERPDLRPDSHSLAFTVRNSGGR